MRSNPKAILHLLIAAVALTAADHSARADAIFDALKCDPKFIQHRSNELPPLEVNFPQQFVSIQQFNPAKGTLCHAVVRITASFDALIQAENLSSTNAIITAGGTQTVYVTPPTFVYKSTIPNTQDLPTVSHLVGPYDGTPDFAGPSSTSFTYQPDNPFDVMIANLILNKDNEGFGNFTGLGAYDFGISGEGEVEVSSNTGTLLAKSNFKIGVKIDVEYHYIPEPASLALMLPVLLLIRRRRQR